MSNADGETSAFLQWMDAYASKPIQLLTGSQHCYEEYIYKANYLDADCFKSTLSRALSTALIAGSLLVKVPQILKLWNSKSSYGISFFSVMMDLAAITIYASYNIASNFPFLVYGDSAFLGIQTAIVAYLVLHYSNKVWEARVFAVVYSLIAFALANCTPLPWLWVMQACNIPILLIGKLSQAAANYKNGSTGQLSAVTVIMLLGGSSARIFTSIQETGDMMAIVTYLASTFANAVIFAQLIYYWNADATKDQKKKQAEKKKKKQ